MDDETFILQRGGRQIRLQYQASTANLGLISMRNTYTLGPFIAGTSLMLFNWIYPDMFNYSR
jgi:hypothetical protein